jgi:hypothetical protein
MLKRYSWAPVVDSMVARIRGVIDIDALDSDQQRS